MSRPKKHTVDYFPHDCNGKKTIFILESQFGNDGYAFWFKLLEILGNTEGHFYDYKDSASKLFLLSKTKVSEEISSKILLLLSEVGAIDKELWKEGIIWSENFINRLEDVYKRRKVDPPQKPILKGLCQQKPQQSGIKGNINLQSKVKESKVKESKVKESKVNNKEEFCFLKDKNFIEAFNDYLEMRKVNGKKITERAKELRLKDLHRYDIKIAIKMLEQSTKNSWTDVYELKNEGVNYGKSRSHTKKYREDRTI